MATFSSPANAGFATPPQNKGAQSRSSGLWGQSALGGGGEGGANSAASIIRGASSNSIGPTSSSPFLRQSVIANGSRSGTPLARSSALAASGSSSSPFARSVVGTPLHQSRGPSAPFNTPVAHALSRTNAANSGLIKAAALPVLSAAAGAKGLPNVGSNSAYSGLVKAALKARLFRLYVLSFVSLHLALCVSLASPLAPILSLISPVLPTLVALSVATFLVGVLPLLVAQKWVISRGGVGSGDKAAASGSLLARLPPGSPASHSSAVLRSGETLAFVSLYAASGVVLALSHIAALMLYAADDDASWAPYTTIRVPNSRGGGSSLATRPNERFFALVVSQAALGASFAVLSSLRPDVFAGASRGARFDASSTTTSLGSRVSSAVSSRLGRALTLGASFPPALLMAYAPFRRPLFRLVLSYLGPGSPLRPLLVPSFRHSFLSASLLARASALGSASALAWTISSALWEVYSTQPVAELSTSVKEPTKCLVDGLAGAREGRSVADRYFAAFAFAELSLVAGNNAARRKAIFKELAMPGAGPANGLELRSGWAAVASECLAVLEAEKKALLARKEQPKAASQPASAVASSSKPQQQGPATGHDILVKNASSSPVRPAVPGVWDKIAAAIGASGTPKAGPPAPKPASAPASASASGSSPAAGAGGDLWKRLVPEASPAPSTPAKQAPNGVVPPKAKLAPPPATPSKRSIILAQLWPIVAQLGSIVHAVWLALPCDARHVVERSYPVRSLRTRYFIASRPSPALLARTLYPRDAALSTWAAQSLSSLTAHSIEEDEYGTVALAKGKCGVEEVLKSCAELLVALCEWGREAEEMARGVDEGVSKIWSSETVTKQGGEEEERVGEEREREARALRAAWDERGAPLGLALRAGITLVVGSFEPHGLQLSQGTRDVVEKALSLS